MSDERGAGVRLVAGLSSAARTVWAKHDRQLDGWLPLWRHMADSAAVAGLLWDQWLPRSVCELIGTALPAGVEDGRRLAVWLASVHDVGKATPAFACQVDDLAEVMRTAGLAMRQFGQLRVDRAFAPHGLASQFLIQEWLTARHGFGIRDVGQFGIVVGGHHGVPPGHEDMRGLRARPQLLRTAGPTESVWRGVQDELLDACADVYKVSDQLTGWRGVQLPQPVQVLLSALVIVADWIASNPDLFPYFPEDATRSESERIEAAWRGLRLPGPWRAQEPSESAQDLIAARFALPPGAVARPVQIEAVASAREMDAPGLMIVEAPMGEGKTEAALAAVEVLAARFGAGGCIVALPTMATGNAMLPRLLEWLRRLPPDAGLPVERSVLLAHSKAALNEEFADLMRSSRRTVAAVDLDGADQVWRPTADVRSGSSELVAHQWLRGRKKGMLASFVVGTIDQLLFAGLKSRHLAMRHLALSGKIVVIDEVHAYDAYMNTYLDRVLSWLGAYRVPVVVLSATLPERRRRELAEAYAGGSDDADCAALESARGYPLITTVVPGRAASAVPVAASGRHTDVQLEQLDDDLLALADRLGTELAGGGCALVVRNTVNRVLETAALLRDRFGAGAVTVAHARFLDLDRAANDAGLMNLFGPPKSSDDARPVGPHIVVASQVAEQSLDVDFDLLVSDLCPVDLLLQRMGRLHRHTRERPDRLRVARCLVAGVDWAAEPPEPVRGSQIVYGRYPLLRSLAALRPHVGQQVRLPEDISDLVQRAYGPTEIGPGSWAQAMDAARTAHESHLLVQQNKAEAFRLDVVRRDGRPLYGWVQAGVGDADDTRAGRAQVRDSQETIEVLVLQRRADGVLTTVPWLDRGRGGLELPVDAVPPAHVARIVAASGLRLPVAFANAATADRAIAELEQLFVPAWQAKESSWLAGELILVLDEGCRTSLAEYELRYNPTDGLEVTRAAVH